MFNELKNVKTMKKKQILFLFAASALFAACSSDELPTNNGSNEQGGGEETTEVYASSVSMTTEEGVGMKVGALNTADTRATGTEQGIYLEVPLTTGTGLGNDVILEKYGEYLAKVDDFAIRKNGDYLELSSIYDTSATTLKSNTIKVVDVNGLYVSVDNLQLLSEEDDWTFEVYLWIDNKKRATNGSGSYEELFTEDDKWTWIGGEAAHEGEDPLETGIDITKELDGYVTFKDANNTEGGTKGPDTGYWGRFNVYRGISGRPSTDGDGIYTGVLGDTPYIKVSIHVNKVADDVKTEVTPIYPSED